MPPRQNDLPASEIYLPSEGPDAVESFLDPATGLPQVHIVEQRYGGRTIWRFCHDLTGRLVTPSDRRLTAAGLIGVELRGSSHYEKAARAGDFRPGKQVTLLRQPDNKFDPNAVAVCANGSTAVAGYVNKQKARRVAALLDEGSCVIEAMAIEGDPPGQLNGRIAIVIAEPRLLDHVTSPRPEAAAKPAHWV